MKNFNLNHQYTPKILEKLNAKIQSVLDSEELDDALLKSLVEKRDAIITQHLEELNSVEEKEFAESELEINRMLSEHINKQLKSSLKQLSGLLRGRKAIKKYK